MVRTMPDEFQPIGLGYFGKILQVTLRNGMVLSVDQDKVIRIGVSPFDRAIALSTDIINQQLNS